MWDQAALALKGVKALLEWRKDDAKDISSGMPTERHSTCAVVGNGNGVLRANFGPYINAHQAVVRFNLAATKSVRHTFHS